ncbi:hypothetical protein GCM10018952_19350 [Streptosporangium vulgare]
MMIGKAKVKITASRSRKNILFSIIIRDSPSRITEGCPARTAGAKGRARVWLIWLVTSGDRSTLVRETVRRGSR